MPQIRQLAAQSMAEYIQPSNPKFKDVVEDYLQFSDKVSHTYFRDRIKPKLTIAVTLMIVM